MTKELFLNIDKFLNNKNYHNVWLTSGFLTAIACSPVKTSSLEISSLIQKGNSAVILPNDINPLIEFISISLNDNNFQFPWKYFFESETTANMIDDWFLGFSLGISLNFIDWHKASNIRIWDISKTFAIIGDHDNVLSLKPTLNEIIACNKEFLSKYGESYIQEIYDYFQKGIVKIHKNNTLINQILSIN